MPAPRVDIGPSPSLAARLGRRGWALTRTLVLVTLTGLLVAAVVAPACGGILIAIDGRLP
jgi:hypothetical protein